MPEIDGNTLERLIPDKLTEGETTGDQTLRLHLDRYRFASSHVRPGRLLDLACGVGYGTRFLVDHCPGVSRAVGVDISQECIDYAKERYDHPRITFVCSDAYDFEPPTAFDTIVSLETLEHVKDPKRLILKLSQVLRVEGVFVASVPVTPSVDANPYHVTDFTENTFRDMFPDHYDEIDHLVQRQEFSPISLACNTESRSKGLRSNIVKYYLQHPSRFLARLRSTLKYGFENRYLTVAWRMSARDDDLPS